ncbi:MAG: transporter [Burkholderiaceae bacterium]|jgi:hypothetical protein|nr:transporter [Burkholderiaceae bacterium]
MTAVRNPELSRTMRWVFRVELSRTMRWVFRVLVLALALIASPALGQDIEPRAYSNAPIGINFLGVGYAEAQSTRYRTGSEILGYSHVFALAGQSARIDVVVPYAQMTGTAPVGSQSVTRATEGLTDPLLRLAVNLYGAPALNLEEFASYQQDLIIGASLKASVPWGNYDSRQLVNIGANRWFVQPAIGASQAIGPWKLELATAVTLFTDNKDFFGGNTRSQDPLYSTEGHIIYGFKSGAWLSMDVTYLTGGQSSINGRLNNDLQENWRFGATLAIPVNRNNSIKLYASQGVFSRTGNGYDLFGIAWQYRWGAGL